MVLRRVRSRSVAPCDAGSRHYVPTSSGPDSLANPQRKRIPRVSYTLLRGGGCTSARANAVTVAEIPSIRLWDLLRSGFAGWTLSLRSPCRAKHDAFQFSTGLLACRIFWSAYADNNHFVGWLSNLKF